MALITEWTLDGNTWNKQSWDIGTPITKEKLENLETGISILATQMKAVLGEIGGILDNSVIDNMQLNTSRIDRLEKEIGGTQDSSGAYSDTRLDNFQTWITGSNSGTYNKSNIDNRLNEIENELSTNSGGTGGISRLDKLTLNLYGSNVSDYSSESRIDKAIKWITGGATMNYTNNSSIDARTTTLETNVAAIQTLDGTQNGRLSALEGRATSAESSISNINTLNTIQDNKLSAILTELGGGTVYDTSYSGTSRLTDLEKEICGPTISRDTQNGGFTNSRIDYLQNWITGTISGTYDITKGSIASRLDTLNQSIVNLDNVNNTQNNRLGTLESHDSTHSSDINNIISEIGGTYSTSSGFSNSYIATAMQDHARIGELDTIKNEVWGPNKEYNEDSRIDTLESNASNLNSTSLNHESRITRIENTIDSGTTTAITPLLFTTNETVSDTLTLGSNDVFAPNGITLIMLNKATVGAQQLKLIDPSGLIEYPIYVSKTIALQAQFAEGSILGIYLSNEGKAYMINAPLAI